MDENTIGIFYIPTILERTDCRKHKVPKGVPCFHADATAREGFYAAVCFMRAKRAGFTGRINPQSLSLKKRPKNN